MSFTSVIKTEISKIDATDIEYIAELSAIFRNVAIINNDIKVISENASVSRRIFNLIKNTYQVTPKIIVRRGYNFNKGYLYILEINKKVDVILNDLSLNEGSVPKNYIIDDSDLKRAYLRGLFMAAGSINDPKKSRYHLEFLVSDREYANFIKKLLNYYNLNSKIIDRDNKFMVYIKEAEKIGDFLRIINASNAVLYYEDIRIYRDHKNMTNRLNNCEQANIDKIIFTSTKQINDIELIKNKVSLDVLDDKLKEVAIYRSKYPDSSLSELSNIISIETGNKITKSGLYHRLKKISIIADKMKRNQENK